jgi:hypothetical protein
MSSEMRAKAQPVRSSNRQFGLIFAVFLLFLGALPALRGQSPATLLLVAALLFAVLAWLQPGWLERPHRAWIMLGDVLHRITNPLILGLVFWGVMTPIGWFLRLKERDFFGLKIDRAAESYWVAREPRPNSNTTDLRRQF